MRRFLALVAMASLNVAPVYAESSQKPRGPVDSHAMTPAVAKIVDFVKASGLKTLVYFELDDSLSNPGTISLTILAQRPGKDQIYIFDNEATAPFLPALASEAASSGKNGWRTISIVVDKDAVTVERRPTPGPISGITARLRDEANRVFQATPMSD